VERNLSGALVAISCLRTKCYSDSYKTHTHKRYLTDNRKGAAQIIFDILLNIFLEGPFSCISIKKSKFFFFFAYSERTCL